MSCTIPANPDIAGVGVRVSVYIQAALMLIPAVLKLVEDIVIEDAYDKQAEARPSTETAVHKGLSGISKYQPTAVEWDDVAELMNPNLALGYALIISGIIQAHTFNLSVYHAITILNLNWIISFSILPCFFVSKNDERKGGKGSGYYLKGRYYMIQLVLTAAFGLWLFTNIGKFDKADDDCTSTTIYSLPGKTVDVTKPAFRRFWVAIYSIMVIPLINFIVLGLFFVLFMIGGTLALLVPYSLLFILSSTSPKLRRTLGSSIPLVGCSILFFLPQILFLVITERTIAINEVGSDEGLWTFGQTTALFLALSSIRTTVTQIQKTVANIKRIHAGEIHELRCSKRVDT